jgi:RNA polymerase sigma-70 factor (ECF subfamily)
LSAVENVTDERLLVAAAQQDPACFAELYEQNFDRVYGYVSRRVRDREEAEDVTAEVFHEALASLHRFEWRGVPFSAWLLGIAAHAIADRYQRAARATEIPLDAAPEPGVEQEIERHAILSRLVETLPADQQYVILRRFVDQRSTREIAAELKRSEGAVRQLQFRALESLRALIKE